MNEGLPSSISIILNQMSALLFHWSHRRPLQLLWRQSDIDGQAFLLQRPDGAYTTMRTLVGGRRIFDWQMHADRLFTSSIVPISQPKETSGFRILDMECQRPTLCMCRLPRKPKSPAKRLDRDSLTFFDLMYAVCLIYMVELPPSSSSWL